MKVLILRKCDNKGKSNNGRFQYPDKGKVEAPDWNGKPECGSGLHGLLWGSGNFDVNEYGTRWQVIEVDTGDGLVEFDGKCKFHKGNVLLTTDSQTEAITMLKTHPNYPKNNILNYDTTDKRFAISGNWSIQKAGDRSTQTAGDESTQTAGHESIQKAGYRSVQTAGNKSIQKASNWSVQTAGNESIQTAGNWSIQTAGNWSIQAAGNESTQKAGLNSIQIGYWYDYYQGNYQTAHRKVTRAMANKPYYFERGKWTLVKGEGK